MKKLVELIAVILVLTSGVIGQQTSPDEPATAEDVQNYLMAMHSTEMTRKMLASMAAPFHQMIKDLFAKDADSLPPDFEQRMNAWIDDYLNEMPIEEIQKAMVPVYQKHFTKGDLSTLAAFYSSPTGQKVLHEMPAVMAESMTVEMPYMREQLDKLRVRMQDQIASLRKRPMKPADKSAPHAN